MNFIDRFNEENEDPTTNNDPTPDEASIFDFLQKIQMQDPDKAARELAKTFCSMDEVLSERFSKRRRFKMIMRILEKGCENG